MIKSRMLALFSTCLLGGCANVTFHTQAGERTGLKYYTAKPYLLVSPTGNKDFPLKAEIISLPDLENPTYAIYHPGWGQHIFNLAVSSNGSLSSYGQTADSKIPETITALGSLASLAAAVKNATSETPETVSAPTASVKLLVQSAIDELSKIASVQPQNDLVLDRALRAEQLKKDLKRLIDAGVFTKGALTTISKLIENAKIDKAHGETPEGHVNQYFKQAKEKIDEAVEALEAAAPKEPDVRLYEIKMEGGQTKLIRVPVPDLRGN